MEDSLVGQEVSRLCFDFSILIETVNDTELRIEGPFQLSYGDSTQLVEVDPDRLGQTGAALLRLLRQQVEYAQVSESGELSLRFTNGERLQCPPDARFEAWTLVTASGGRMVCMPGGGVARWSDASSQ